MKFNTVAAAVSAAMLAGVSNAEEAEASKPELVQFTVSLCLRWLCAGVAAT